MDMGQFSAPGGLFDDLPTNTADQLNLKFIGNDQLNGNENFFFDSVLNEVSGEEWMEDMEISSESMDSLLELQQITEVKPEPIPPTRPSVIRKTSTDNSLSAILSSCGIEEVTNNNVSFYPHVEMSIGSPSGSSEASEMDQNQELIEELEDFFIKTEGTPTTITENEYSATKQLDMVSTLETNTSTTNPDQILKALSTGNVLDTTILKEEDLSNAYTTSVVSEDGQNVIIIIAPPSPTQTVTSDYESNYDTDPDWAPSPNPGSPQVKDTPPVTKTIRKKYARKKPPQPPSGPYPVEKKERKKAQNRTAAFRYREKKKNEQDGVDTELEILSQKNNILREKLTEMETEFKYLKKLMTEAGLGQYAAAVSF